MERAVKIKIYPTKNQQILLQKSFGCRRWVWNTFLDLREQYWKDTGEHISVSEMSRILTRVKHEPGYEWLCEPDKDCLQKTLKDLDEAYRLFFQTEAGFPKFRKRKNESLSYRTANNSADKRCKNFTIRILDKNHINLPKIGRMKCRGLRNFNGRILNATISQEPDGKYYCSLCYTNIQPIQLPKTGNDVGIDLGTTDFAIFSNGVKIENPRFHETHEKKLVRLQKELSRKTNGSKNYERARIKLAKEWAKERHRRQDFLQKITTQIVKDYDIICIEDLNVKQMSETKSSQKNKRNRDVGWFTFRRMLEYKCEQYGKHLVIIDRYFPSSQICSMCGCSSGKKTLDIRQWTCPECGAELDRDINAAINILNEGLRILSA